MFFSMARKSSMVPVSSGKFDSSKQLTTGDIEVHDSFLLINGPKLANTDIQEKFP